MPAKLGAPRISASTSSQAEFPQADECMYEVAGIYKTKPCLLFRGTSCGSTVHPFILLQEAPAE